MLRATWTLTRGLSLPCCRGGHQHWPTSGGEGVGGARDLERRLAEARGRATALADALAVMSRAPTDLVAVLETVLDRAANMCDAERASIHLLEADGYHTAAFWGPTSEEYKRLAYDTVRTREGDLRNLACDRELANGRAAGPGCDRQECGDVLWRGRWRSPSR